MKKFTCTPAEKIRCVTAMHRAHGEMLFSGQQCDPMEAAFEAALAFLNRPATEKPKYAVVETYNEYKELEPDIMVPYTDYGNIIQFLKDNPLPDGTVYNVYNHGGYCITGDIEKGLKPVEVDDKDFEGMLGLMTESFEPFTVY